MKRVGETLSLLFVVFVLPVVSYWPTSNSTWSSSQSPTASPSPEPESECAPEEGFWRPGATYNDPRQLITQSAVECCDICSADSRCVTWSRQRATGACALKDSQVPMAQNGSYDSGSVAANRAEDTTTLPRCFLERGLSYPNGEVIQRVTTRTGRACCNRCRNNVDCFSWFRDSRNGACVLNRNVPPRQNAGSAFTGSALI